MNPSDLESLIQRKLAELPAPKAPGTLLPRIMAEVRRTGRSPWRQRAWISGVWQHPAVPLAAWTVLILIGVLAVGWSSGSRIENPWGGFLATAEEAAIGAGRWCMSPGFCGGYCWNPLPLTWFCGSVVCGCFWHCFGRHSEACSGKGASNNEDELAHIGSIGNHTGAGRQRRSGSRGHSAFYTRSTR